MNITDIPKNRPVQHVNWHTSKVNIIYIPFGEATFSNWYTQQQHMKVNFRTTIIPDNIIIRGRKIRSTRYYTDIVKKMPYVRFFKNIKTTMDKPVIIDTTPVITEVHKMLKSGSMIRTLDSMFEFISSLYHMLQGSRTLSVYETIVIFDDHKSSINDVEHLINYLRFKSYEIPYQICTSKALVYLGDIGYYPLIFQGELLKQNVMRLAKFNEKLYNNLISAEKDDSDLAERDIVIQEKVLVDVYQKLYNKKGSKEDLEKIKEKIEQYIKEHPDYDIKLGDPSSIIPIFEKEENKDKQDQRGSFSEDVTPKMLNNLIKKPSLDNSKITNMKTIVSSDRTKKEFSEILDKNIYKMIESLNDPQFKMTVLSVNKKIVDDSSSRYAVYTIKIKPDNGRAYTVNLQVPALVHDTYFKIGGNYYVINNQLMQKPIIKKSSNIVQLKTNYSVINYEIYRSVTDNHDYASLVQLFLNNLKTIKKLKSATVISNKTENVLKEYGVPVDVVSTINYEKIEIKI